MNVATALTGTRTARTRGTGSVQSKPNGAGRTYYAVVRVNGKPKWLKAGPTRADAENLLHQVYAGVVDPWTYGRGTRQAEHGRFAASSVSAEAWTFADYAEAWLEWLETRPRKPGTKSEYRGIVRNVLVPCLGSKLLADLEPRDAWELVAQRVNGRAPVAGRCRRSVSRERALREFALLRKMLNDALRRRYIDENPCEGLADELREEFTHVGRRRVVLSDEQVAVLLAATPAKHAVLMRLLARSGLRLGEALALRISSLDVAAGTLQVDETWSHSRIVAVKTDAGQRALRLSPQLAALLAEHCSRVAGPGNPDGWMFPGVPRRGGRALPLDPAHWRKAVFHPAARAAGLPMHTVPHSLRHSAAVAWLRGRVDPAHPERSVRPFSRPRVQALLGHASAASTEWYTRMTPGDWADSYDVLD